MGVFFLLTYNMLYVTIKMFSIRQVNSNNSSLFWHRFSLTANRTISVPQSIRVTIHAELNGALFILITFPG